MIGKVVDQLNALKVRATYGAVAELIGVHPRQIGQMLGDRCSRNSWIVSAQTGMPTGYTDAQIHPDVPGSHVVRTAGELGRLLGGAAKPPIPYQVTANGKGNIAHTSLP